MIKKLGFDSGQKQQIVITSQLPLVPYLNLKPSYVLGNGIFPRGIETPQREAKN